MGLRGLTMHLSLISLSLGAAAATPPPQQVPPVITHFASAPQTCAVLQAAYTAAIGHKTPVYPHDVRSDSRVLDLAKMVPDYRATLAMSARESDRLAEQENRYSFPNFKPSCAWRGSPGPLADAEGHATFVTFTSPIFSVNRRLAIVEVSFREAGMFGYGMICVVRQQKEAWKGRCQSSWIT